MIIEQAGFNSDYRRQPGVYAFQAADGTPVHALAVPCWDKVETALAQEPPMGGIVITPELITTSDVITPLDKMPGLAEVTAERIARVAELSLLHPGATILLGSATLDQTNQLHNSLVVIRDGSPEGAVDKYPIRFDEIGVYSQERRRQAALPIGHAAVICSDIIVAAQIGGGHSDRAELRERLGSPAVHTLCIGACWCVPFAQGVSSLVPDEERYKGQLETVIGMLFGTYPGLQKIVMVDRQPADGASGVDPLTAIFTRHSAGGPSAVPRQRK